jgi:hypothetical protein
MVRRMRTAAVRYAFAKEYLDRGDVPDQDVRQCLVRGLRAAQPTGVMMTCGRT